MRVAKLTKRARAFFQFVASGFRKWPQPPVPDLSETERLDRIRNPSKYLGK
jgi:hypothetical protein